MAMCINPDFVSALGNRLVFLGSGLTSIFQKLDQATRDRVYGFYTRVLVDVDLSANLPHSLMVERDDHCGFVLNVVYENLPSRYARCNIFGHDMAKCQKNGQNLTMERGDLAHGRSDNGVGFFPVDRDVLSLVVDSDTDLESLVENISFPIMNPSLNNKDSLGYLNTVDPNVSKSLHIAAFSSFPTITCNSTMENEIQHILKGDDFIQVVSKARKKTKKLDDLGSRPIVKPLVKLHTARGRLSKKSQ
ncbi:hypothetical protein Dsin_001970 [Dipteronia sinensis]|uniref:Zinc knuckle CX2CX4HX4C domain-containing protein n=1 Tax=Dipteronia sinensis TaxID=43782 RepID=A0AAE0B6N0_9ROSI|nr:hypothetical protein Dsin_001970 [Dipteronia sinensis]